MGRGEMRDPKATRLGTESYRGRTGRASAASAPGDQGTGGPARRVRRACRVRLAAGVRGSPLPPSTLATTRARTAAHRLVRRVRSAAGPSRPAFGTGGRRCSPGRLRPDSRCPGRAAGFRRCRRRPDRAWREAGSRRAPSAGRRRPTTGPAGAPPAPAGRLSGSSNPGRHRSRRRPRSTGTPPRSASPVPGIPLAPGTSRHPAPPGRDVKAGDPAAARGTARWRAELVAVGRKTSSSLRIAPSCTSGRAAPRFTPCTVRNSGTRSGPAGPGLALAAPSSRAAGRSPPGRRFRRR